MMRFCPYGLVPLNLEAVYHFIRNPLGSTRPFESISMISMTIPPDDERVIIEVNGQPFGILVKLRMRYRFFASDRVAFKLDRLVFRSPFEAENAVARLMQARGWPEGGRTPEG